MPMTWVFWFWVLVLAALLSWPVSNLIWVISVRRLQRKLKRELEAHEVAAQRQRAWFIAIFVCAIFAFLFVLNLQQEGVLIGE